MAMYSIWGQYGDVYDCADWQELTSWLNPRNIRMAPIRELPRYPAKKWQKSEGVDKNCYIYPLYLLIC